MLKLWKKILLACAFCLIMPVLVLANGNEPIVRVGILNNQAQVTISAQNDFVMKVPTENRKYRFPAGKQLVFTYKQGKALLNNKPLRGDDIIIAVKDRQPVLINNRPYRGALNLLINSKGITVVNRVGMEEYLYGVVPAEMPYTWPKEALKAQTIAARTFALHYKKLHENDGKPYDLCNTTACQVYRGISEEKAGIKAIVDSTRGEILTYNNEPIAAVFHAASGGSTISSEEGWGSKVPYLQATLDRNEKSPYSNWLKEYNTVEFTNILRKKIPNLQGVKKLDLTHYGKNQITSGKKEIGIVDNNGKTYYLSGADFRTLFKLDSSNFIVETTYGNVPKKVENPIAKIEIKPNVNDNKIKKAKKVKGNLYGVNKVVVEQAKSILPTVKVSTNVSMVKIPIKFKIIGSGLGHRIGMSQWGAKGDAEAGKDYISILKHYYTGVNLQRLY